MKHYLLKLVISFAAGGAASLAMAPTNFWPVLFISLGALYVILASSGSPRGAFGYGWVFGFGYFLFGLNWVSNALLVDGNPHAWAWPLAVSGLPALLAFFTGFACLLARKFSNLKTLSGFVAFTAFLTLFEWARGHVFTGFPWNLYGYTWADIPQMVQTVSIANIYFLTWLTLFLVSLPAFLWKGETTKTAKGLTALTGLLLFALCFGHGAWRLNTIKVEYHDSIEIRMVQPSIEQQDKWDRAKMAENFRKYIELSRPEKPSGKITYIVWPETALSHWYTQDPTFMRDITDMLHSYWNPAYLFTGMLRYEPESNTYRNSLVMIDRQGQISNIYDKHHLVPFGEYIPFQKWIPLKPVVQFTGFAKGQGPQHFTTPEGLTYSPLVCYEAIFPGAVRNTAQHTPDFMINVTNDAWYGISAGPHQHYVQALFRAIEEGVPLVRAANTGISGLIDPLGRTSTQTALFKAETQSVLLPKKLDLRPLKPFYQNIILLLMILITISLGYIRKDRFALSS